MLKKRKNTEAEVKETKRWNDREETEEYEMEKEDEGKEAERKRENTRILLLL